MIKCRNILLALLSVVVLLSLSGCNMLILKPMGVIAADERELLITAVLLMLLVVVPVIILTGFIAVKYRASNTKAKYTPDWGHSVVLEFIWWVIPCLIIGALAIITWFSTHRLDPYRPLDASSKPLTIEAVALDWKWLFIYPDQNIATVNFVQIPVNTQVRFLITSDAPMNSLEIPQLAGQIYAMAGMQTKLYLMATSPGNFFGLSTNYSGTGFAGMNFTVKASSQAEFQQWVANAQHSSQALTVNSYNTLALPSENNPATYFSPVVPGLFENIMMKYMMPMPGSMPDSLPGFMPNTTLSTSSMNN